MQPRTGKPQPPTPLDGQPLAFDDPADRRVSLAKWLTAPENPYFARSIANRVWANFFGVGLVEKVDDMRVSNPASNDALLAAAADYLVKQKFDLKALMKVDSCSRTPISAPAVPLPGNQADHRFYSRYYPKRLMAEVLHDAIVQVSQVPTKFDTIAFPGGDVQKTDFYPIGTRAVQLYDSAVENYFLQTFGRNPRRIVCECERSDEPTMVQVLHLSNGITLNEKLKAPGNRARQADQAAPGRNVDAGLDRRDLSGQPVALSQRRRAKPPDRTAAAAGRYERARDRRGHLLGPPEQPRVPVQSLTERRPMRTLIVLAVGFGNGLDRAGPDQARAGLPRPDRPHFHEVLHGLS